MVEEQNKTKFPISKRADFLFEVSWEVCNKVGGIYTVLESKTHRMLDYYGENYYLIGPYLEENAKGLFQEQPPPPDLEGVFLEMEKNQLKCHFGRWLIPGEPKVILLESQAFFGEADQIKRRLWEDFQVDSLKSGQDFNEPVVWSFAVGELLEKIALTLKDKKMVAHFHEWLSGAGLLYLKKSGVNMGTVFTTHATTLGRTLSFHEVDFYSVLDKIDPEQKAENYNVKAKHQLERAAAQNCDVFTTVSEITALETERFLQRKPDFLLPNGLDIERFPAFEDLAFKHRVHRDRLREFCAFYFFPYYNFDLKNTLFYFTASRYEFRAKGIDILIKSLGLLNQKLILIGTQKTIVVFFWVPAAVDSVRSEILENKEFFYDIKDFLEEGSADIQQKILYSLVRGKTIKEKNLFEEDFVLEMKKKVLRFKRKGLPPLSTHKLADSQDSICKAFQQAGLTNKREDRVKVIFYPIYLTGHDGLSNLNYQESIEACHLGIFPSFYEPWGYTPLESAALAVASVTTDLAGFGRYISHLSKSSKEAGIFVAPRFNQSESTAVKNLAKIIYHFTKFNKFQRAANKIQARKLANAVDWQHLIFNYIEAHNKACP